MLKGARRNLGPKLWFHHNSTQSSITNLGRIPLDHNTLPGIVRMPTKGIKNSIPNGKMTLNEWLDLRQLLQPADLIFVQIKMTIDMDHWLMVCYAHRITTLASQQVIPTVLHRQENFK